MTKHPLITYHFVSIWFCITLFEVIKVKNFENSSAFRIGILTETSLRLLFPSFQRMTQIWRVGKALRTDLTAHNKLCTSIPSEKMV